MKKWIDYEEWKYNLAWRHYQHKLFWNFGTREINNLQRINFNKFYIDKYPKNAKIIFKNENN